MKTVSSKWEKAIVTGAASGIGLEYCRQLSAQGCSVLMVDRSPLDEAVTLLQEGECPGALHTLQVDLTDADAIEEIMSWLNINAFMPDLLINNAGIFDFKPIHSLSIERLDIYIELHIRAMTLLCRMIGEMMKQRGYGYIINMSSMSCWMPMPGIAMYSATKAYIRVFSRALGNELHDYGVKVLVACPGGIATNLFGLPENLQRLGVRLGVLATPQLLVRHILRHAARGKRQYINGLLNRVAIFFVYCLPNCVRVKIGHYAEKNDG